MGKGRQGSVTVGQKTAPTARIFPHGRQKEFAVSLPFSLTPPIPALQHVDAQQALALPSSQQVTHCPPGTTTMVNSHETGPAWDREDAAQETLALPSQQRGMGMDVLGEIPS